MPEVLEPFLSHPFGRSAALLAGALVTALVLHAALLLAFRRADPNLHERAAPRVRGPARAALLVVATQIALPLTDLDEEVRLALQHAVALALIASVAMLLFRIVRVVEAEVMHRHRLDVRDNLVARRVHTQFRVLRRLAMVTIVVIAVAAALMTFPRVRQLGTGLFASAGVLGLVVGIAARPLVANLVAGVQLALAQPFRLDDVVVLEGEWGRIEEINATFVVVALWDDRRLVVPLSWFETHTFQNWTRTRSELLGTVLLHLDPGADVAPLREELVRVTDASERWDRRVRVLQVVETTERTMVVRALVSASDAATAFDLRCEVRERLLAYLRDHQPEALPRARLEVERRSEDPSGTGGAEDEEIAS